MPGANGPCRHILGHYRTSPNHSALSDRHAGMNKCLGRQPGIVANGNWLGDQRKARSLIIVSASTEMNSLRNHSASPDRYSPLRIQSNTVGDSRTISEPHVPRSPDSHSSIDVNPSTHVRPKKAQKKSAPGMQRARRESKEKAMDHTPSHPTETIADTEGWPLVRIGINFHFL